MSWRLAVSQEAMDLGLEIRPRALPLSLLDQAHLRQHNAVGRRASDVGGETNEHADWTMIARTY